jgi:hypothetical protein
MKIGSAVGRQPALNAPKDQQTIITLLHRILPEDGGPGTILPPPTPGGLASQALIDAILNFQRKHAPKKFQDGRVDPHGFTLGKMNAFARSIFPIDPPDIPPDPNPFPPPAPKPNPAPPPPTPSVMRALGFNATNWKIVGSQGLSFSLGPTGAVMGRFTIQEQFENGATDDHLFDFMGASLGHGPLPFGVEISPSFFPAVGTQVYSRNPKVVYNSFKGPITIMAAATNIGLPGGPNGALLAFGIRISRKDATIMDLLRGAKMVGAVGGTFAGLSIGVSLAAGAMV